MGCKCSFDIESKNNDLEFQQQAITPKNDLLNENPTQDDYKYVEYNEKLSDEKLEQTIKSKSKPAKSKFSPFNLKRSKQTEQNLLKQITTLEDELENSVLFIDQLPSKEDSLTYLMKYDNKKNNNIKIESKENLNKLNERNSFIENMLKYINLARTKPMEFTQYIIDSIQYITQDAKKTKGTEYIFTKDKIKVGLLKGKDAFINAAEILVMQDSLPILELKQDLIIDIPEDKNQLASKVYIEDYLNKLLETLDYKLFGFHFDLGVTDPLTSVVLQIVDDNLMNGERRNNIFNPNYRYVGISKKRIGKLFCIYLAFGSY